MPEIVQKFISKANGMYERHYSFRMNNMKRSLRLEAV